MSQKLVTALALRTCHCDMFGHWRPGSILEAMQETAGEHSASYGLSRSVMDGMGIAWVLSRVRVEMKRLPVAGETVTIETYPTPNRHLFFPRSHVFRDETGEEIGTANSLWVLMDLESRRIIKDDRVTEKVPDNRELQPAAGMPATVRAPEGEKQEGSIQPQFTDLDLNRHVNNTKYLDWCLNALGVETLEAACVMRFDVNYEAEIRPGSVIRTELTRSGDGFVFCGFDGDKKHFSIGGTLGERAADSVRI